MLDTRQTTVYKVLYVTPSGREYLATLTAMGNYCEAPPFVAFERDDGIITASVRSAGVDQDRLYSSLTHLANEHGCMLGAVVSVDPVN